MPARHLAIVGATATGKSTLALALARRAPAFEIVSADSMQVYRGMDVGTAKPTAGERAAVPHHLVDIADPGEDFSVARFQRAAREALADIEARGRRALLVGGTGLYVRAVVDELDLPGEWPDVRAGLESEAVTDQDVARLHARLATVDPLAASRMAPTNRRRVVRALEVCLGSGRPFSSFGPGLSAYGPTPFRIAGVRVDRPLLDERIAARVDAMMAAGFLDEVRGLAGRPLSRTARQALGYGELLRHLEGEAGLEEAVAGTVRRTRSFARRQERWFRRDPRTTWLGHEGNVLALLPGLLGDLTECA